MTDYTRRDHERSISKPIPFEVGLQVPRDFRAEAAPESAAVGSELRQQLKAIFHELARQKECQILEGHLMPDHVHMVITIPPKYAVSAVIGFLKGKSAIAVARLQGKERNFSGEHLWARGYAVSTVGFELAEVQRYVREQDDADEAGRF